MQYIFLIMLLGVIPGCSKRPYPDLNDVPVVATPPDTAAQVHQEVAALWKANQKGMKLLKENHSGGTTSEVQ